MGTRFNISKKLLILLVASSFLFSCRTIAYKVTECQEIPEEALNVAIADYNKILRRSPQRHAVAVHITYTSTDWFYIAMKPWDDENNKYNLSWLQENIGKVPFPWYYPTQYREIDNVLYVWHNPKVVLSEDVVSALVRYNLVYYPDDEMIVSNGGDLTCYVFCKSNHRKYYRRIKPDDYGFVPLPSCNCHIEK